MVHKKKCTEKEIVQDMKLRLVSFSRYFVWQEGFVGLDFVGERLLSSHPAYLTIKYDKKTHLFNNNQEILFTYL